MTISVVSAFDRDTREASAVESVSRMMLEGWSWLATMTTTGESRDAGEWAADAKERSADTGEGRAECSDRRVHAAERRADAKERAKDEIEDAPIIDGLVEA